MSFGCWFNLVRSWTAFSFVVSVITVLYQCQCPLGLLCGSGWGLWAECFLFLFSMIVICPQLSAFPVQLWHIGHLSPQSCLLPSDSLLLIVIQCLLSGEGAGSFFVVLVQLSLSYTLYAPTFVMGLSHDPILPPYDSQTVPCILSGSCLGLSRFPLSPPAKHPPQ